MKLEDYLNLENSLEMSQVLATRDAGKISRVHTMGTVGYSVGEHTYNMMQMLFALHPNPSVILIGCVLSHDVPEIILGDIPAPTKWEYPEIAEAFKNAEVHIFRRLYPDKITPDLLNDCERSWLKALDWLELYLWVLDQQIAGHQEYLIIGERLREHMNPKLFPTKVLYFIEDIEVKTGWRGVKACELFKETMDVFSY